VPGNGLDGTNSIGDYRMALIFGPAVVLIMQNPS
jgi:hypothetical protein